MEDMRSNPNEESLEAPEAREEKEMLDQATHEAEAHVESTRGHEQAEVIEGLVKDMVKGSPEVVDQTQPPGTSDAELKEIGEPEGGDEATPINLPDKQKVDTTGATPLPGSKEGTVSKWEFDPPPEHEREEAILGTPPTEMPPEANELDSDEMVGYKFYKPIPADEESAKFKGEPAMVKGEIGMEPDPPDPDPDIRPDEVVGIKFHPTDEASGPESPGIDLVSKIDSFTKESELHEPPIREGIPDLESPPIVDISDEISKDPAYLKAQDEVSKDNAYLEASERDTIDGDSSPPEEVENDEGA